MGCYADFDNFVNAHIQESDMADTHVMLSLEDYAEIENARRQAEGEAANLRLQVEELKMDNEDLAGVVNTIRNDRDYTRDRLRDRTEERDELREMYKDADLEVDRLRVELERAEEERDKAEDVAHTRSLTIGDLRSRVADLETRERGLHNVLNTKTNTIENLQEQVEALMEEANELRAREAGALNDGEHFRQSFMTVEAEARELRAKMQLDPWAKLSGLRKQVEDRGRAIEKRDAEIAGLRMLLGVAESAAERGAEIREELEEDLKESIAVENELNAKVAKLERLREYAEAMATDFWRLRWDVGTHPGQIVDRMKAEGENRRRQAEAKRATADHKLDVGLSEAYDADKPPEARADIEHAAEYINPPRFGKTRREARSFAHALGLSHSPAHPNPVAMFPGYEPRERRVESDPGILGMAGFLDGKEEWIAYKVNAAGDNAWRPWIDPEFREYSPAEWERLQRRVRHLEAVRANLIKRAHGRHT